MRQKLTIDTISGPATIEGPSGWEFNSTDIICWNMLLSVTRNVNDSVKRSKRDQHALQAQAHVLAICLGRSLGMAAFYWEQQAKEFV